MGKGPIPIVRFANFVHAIPCGGCWIWEGQIKRTGYGQFWDGTRHVRVHRWSYEHHIGPIPEGLVIDHLCRNRACVNPAHLEAVTIRENTRRGMGPTAQRARQTHCVNGHEFTENNIYCPPGRDGVRQCKTCDKIHQASRVRNR